MPIEVIYSRVVNNEIKEFPVYGLHINNRGHSINQYVIVELDEKPEVPEFHFAQLKPILEGNRVFGRWIITPQSLNGILNDIWRPTTLDAEDINYKESISIEDVPQATIIRVSQLVREYVGKKLDNFAQTRQYDNIGSAVTYVNSAVARFKAEGDRAIYLRDMSWASIYEYLEAVMAGTQPVPKNTDDLDVILPTLTWE